MFLLKTICSFSSDILKTVCFCENFICSILTPPLLNLDTNRPNNCRHLRVQECTQDKTRREEDTSLSQFTHQFGRGSLLKNQFYYFKDPSLPFIGRRTVHVFTKKLAREALQGSLLTLPILAPKMESERGTF